MDYTAVEEHLTKLMEKGEEELSKLKEERTTMQKELDVRIESWESCCRRSRRNYMPVSEISLFWVNCTFSCLLFSFIPLLAPSMSIPLSISRISEATTITDPVSFTDFCISQLKQAEQLVVKEKVIVPFDSILFHEYVILDYRQERMTIPLSDRLLEALFLFIQKCVPFYSTEIANNVNNCFYRSFHA